MIDYKAIPVNRDEAGYMNWTKENAIIIADYFLGKMNYRVFLNPNDPCTSAYLLHHFGFEEEGTITFTLTSKEVKVKKADEWKLIDLLIFRINQEYGTRVSERDRGYIARTIRELISRNRLLDGLKNGDMYMLQEIARSGTSFSIKFASLFCRLSCIFHPKLGEDYRENYVVADYKRVVKYNKNPEELRANTAYILYMDELRNDLINMQYSGENLTITDMWLLDLVMENAFVL